jgi:hypothetical protein
MMCEPVYAKDTGNKDGSWRVSAGTMSSEDAMRAPRRFYPNYDPIALLVLFFGIGASTVLALGF